MSSNTFPLSNPGDKDFQGLCAALWGWRICDSCTKTPSKPCRQSQCPWQRAHRLKGFFEYYSSLTSSYVPESIFSTKPVLACHGDVLSIVKLIRDQNDECRESLIKSVGDSGGVSASVDEKNRAFDMGVRVALMVNCSGGDAARGLLELGTRPVQWGATMSRKDFMNAAFPQMAYPTLDGSDSSPRSRHILDAIRATRLRNVAGIRFCPTDDLSNHLRLDYKTGSVYVYHHTAVLKEHLIASALERELGTLRSPELIPRQLALEVLNSIQNVLFPSDPQSQALLRSLVKKQGFDEDCLRYESSTYRVPGETSTQYSYLGTKLLDLYEEASHPTPRGLLETWLEPRSGARYVMMATLAGVAIAITLGVLGLAAQLVQTWMSYQQLKLAREAAESGRG